MILTSLEPNDTWTNQAINNVRRHFGEQDKLPIGAGQAHRLGCTGSVCTCRGDQPLGQAFAVRLIALIMAEGYGD